MSDSAQHAATGAIDPLPEQLLAFSQEAMQHFKVCKAVSLHIRMQPRRGREDRVGGMLNGRRLVLSRSSSNRYEWHVALYHPGSPVVREMIMEYAVITNHFELAETIKRALDEFNAGLVPRYAVYVEPPLKGNRHLI